MDEMYFSTTAALAEELSRRNVVCEVENGSLVQRPLPLVKQAGGEAEGQHWWLGWFGGTKEQPWVLYMAKYANVSSQIGKPWYQKWPVRFAVELVSDEQRLSFLNVNSAMIEQHVADLMQPM